MENVSDQIPSLEVETLKAGKSILKCWKGTIQLTAWQGFGSRSGAYNSVNKKGSFDGTAKLTIGDYVSAEELLPVTPKQVAAYQFTLQHQEQVQEIMLRKLIPYYKELRLEYGIEDGDEGMPDITSIAQFKNLVGLSYVHILNESNDAIAYVGYEFGCTWDVEHGLGIMTHKDRVIEIGDADASFESWIAEKDIDPVKAAADMAAEMKNVESILAQKKKKPWWKIW